MLTYAVLSRLLHYPDADLHDEIDEMVEILKREELLAPETQTRLHALLSYLQGGDLLDLEERYTELFDRTRSLSLHLFEHVHGESRDRGQAMVELNERYTASGLEIAVRELPDYLPLFLEYLSLLPAQRAAAELAEPVALLAAIGERLERRRSPYAAVFAGLVELAGIRAPEEEVRRVLAEPDDDPNDFVSIDRVYAEEPVSFRETPRQAAIGSRLARRREGNR